MKKLFLMFISAILLASCAGITHITTPQTVALNNNNFRFVKHVSAETKATYVLCIGGMSESANEDVIEKLIQEAKLRPNQALADIRVKTTNKHILGFFIIFRTLTASATVVEFGEATYQTSAPAVEYGETKQEVPVSTAETVKPAKNSPREVTLARLKEINALLASGSVDNIESIAAEIDEIEQWYSQKGFYILEERNELRKAKSYIKVLTN